MSPQDPAPCALCRPGGPGFCCAYAVRTVLILVALAGFQGHVTPTDATAQPGVWGARAWLATCSSLAVHLAPEDLRTRRDGLVSVADPCLRRKPTTRHSSPLANDLLSPKGLPSPSIRWRGPRKPSWRSTAGNQDVTIPKQPSAPLHVLCTYLACRPPDSRCN